MDTVGQQRRGSLGDLEVLHFESSSILEPSQSNGTRIHHQIMWYGTCPIAGLGVLLNILVVIVWGDRSSRQSIVFLFKALALMDIVFILMFCIWWYIPESSIFSVLLSIVVFGSQYMLVNVTMLIGVWRWMGYAKPIHIHQLLNHFRAKVALAIIMAYCSVSAITERVLASVLDNDVSKIISIVTPNLLMTLPSLVLVVSMVVLMSFLRRPEVFPNLSSTGHLHFSSNSFNTPGKIRRLTYTILMITITTFIAYPVGGIVLAYFSFSDDKKTKSIISGVCNLLFVLNSSIRFFSYFFFMRKFRKMFLLKFITLYTGTYNIRVPSTSEIQSSRVQPDRSHGGRRISYHHSTVVINDDCTLTVSKAPKVSKEESRDVKVAFTGVGPPKSAP